MARSKDCETACRHRFNNDTDGPVKFLWIDYDGQEHAYATVFPGQSHIQGGLGCPGGLCARVSIVPIPEAGSNSAS